jgi:hypothetical protein
VARFVRPRRPYRPRSVSAWHWQAVERWMKDVEELSDPIADVKPDGKGVPILIRQYMEVGGRVLGFNLDPRFSNALDALILVDLRFTPAPMLARYMTKEGAAGPPR